MQFPPYYLAHNPPRYYPFQHEPLRLARSQSIDKRSL